MLSINARVCAVLDKQKHVQQVVPDSWLKAEVFQRVQTQITGHLQGVLPITLLH